VQDVTHSKELQQYKVFQYPGQIKQLTDIIADILLKREIHLPQLSRKKMNASRDMEKD
jgi:hypothetical protein